MPGEYYDKDPKNVFTMIMNQFATKSRDWEYENEIRFFSQEADSLHAIPGDITEIIFGEYMSEANISEIVEAAKKIKNQVKFFQIAKNVESWGYRCIGMKC